MSNAVLQAFIFINKGLGGYLFMGLITT